MAIPRTFIEELRTRTDLVALLSSYLEVRQQGGRYVALCPFHQEKTPSFSIDPHKGLYHCFGCGISGDAIHFLMERQRLPFREALEQLAQKAGMTIPEERQDTQHQEKYKELRALLEEAGREYRQALEKSPEARAYLEKRGLDAATIAHFALGYAPGDNTIATRLGSSPRRQELLLQAGLLRRNKRGLYDFFRRRIMFPIRDWRGRTISFGGRVLNQDNPKYLNGPESPLFQKSQALYGLYESRAAGKASAPVLVVEGYLDVISLFQRDVRPVVSCMGTALSRTQLQLLFRQGAELIFCFDGDQAGRAAAQRSLEVILPLMREGRSVRFMLLPEGQDPDQLARADAADFRTRMKETPQLSRFLLQSTMAAIGVDPQSAEGKAALAARLAEQLKKIPSSLLRTTIAEELDARTGLSTHNILGQPQSSSSHPSSSPPSSSPPAPPIRPGAAAAGASPPREESWRDHGLPPRRPSKLRDLRRPARTITGILLHAPGLAREMKELPAEQPGENEDMQLLRAVLREFRTEEAPAQENLLARLYGRWQGSPRGQLLENVPTPKLPEDALPQELQDNLDKLWERHERALLKDKMQRGDLSEQELQQMRWQMVREKKQRAQPEDTPPPAA